MPNDVSYFQIEGDPTTYSFNDADAEARFATKVNKAGDTMTGGLIITNNTPVRLQDTAITIGTTPSTTHNGAGVQLADSAGTVFGNFRPIYFNDGRLGPSVSCYRNVGGFWRSNILGLMVDDNGDASVYITAPQAWRDALSAVPTSRTINGKALTADITLDASDVEAIPATGSAAVFIGAAGTWANSSLTLPTTVNGTNAAQNVTFSLPSGATLVGMMVSVSNTYICIMSKRIVNNTTGQVRCYNISSNSYTWASVTARPLYTL